VYWIDGKFPGRIAILPRPRGGDWLDDEIRGRRRDGIDTVVSLLTPDEVADLDLADEPARCRAHGIEFVSHPVPDRGLPPSVQGVADLANQLAGQLADGRNVGVHCRQGIGRSALVIACVLVAAGLDPDTAFKMIAAARGYAVPETPEQRRWVLDHADGFRAAATR
jgi:protein-tyrosine phosphatase